MIIRIGYDIQFDVCAEVPIVALLNVHPSRETGLDRAGHRVRRAGDSESRSFSIPSEIVGAACWRRPARFDFTVRR